MFQGQIITILFVLFVYIAIILVLLKKFNIGKKSLVVFVVPLIIFSLGFLLRLSDNQPLIDLGYFLTDSSGIFLSTLFAFFLMLGQLKYWEK